MRFLHIVPAQEFKSVIPEAEKMLSGHLKDIPYFALALFLRCGIWSNEKRFKEQSRIQIFSTTELKELYGE